MNVCFETGTLVLMEDNTYKKIENIVVGNIVSSFDFDKNEKVEAVVTKTMSSKTAAIYSLTLQNGENIRATAEHPFYVVGYGWKTVKELSVGDVLKSSTQQSLIISSIETEKKTVQVYNFEVGTTHNYFVTGSRILVHNKNIE